MRCVVVSAVYPPEPVVSGRLSHDLSAELVRRGHEVTVLCPMPSRPSEEHYRILLRPETFTTEEDGVTVVRLNSFRAPRSNLMLRMWESLSFGRHASRYIAKHLGDADVIYANSWPVFSQHAVARFSERHGVPLVLHIQDIYPESALLKLPRFLRGWIAGPVRHIDRRNAERAAAIVVISERMRRFYIETRKVPPEQVRVRRNWQDENLFLASLGRSAAFQRYHIPSDRFTFLYLGNFGRVAGVDFLIRAFAAAELPSAQLVLVGGGSEQAACLELAGKLAPRSIHFVDDPDISNVPLLQSMADVCLLPMRKGAGASSIPSKLAAYMFSAKPVLATVDADSETADCLREADCGWVGEPESVEWLAATMRVLACTGNRDLSERGAKGREYGMRHFSRAKGAAQLADIVEASGSARNGPLNTGA